MALYGQRQCFLFLQKVILTRLTFWLYIMVLIPLWCQFFCAIRYRLIYFLIQYSYQIRPYFRYRFLWWGWWWWWVFCHQFRLFYQHREGHLLFCFFHNLLSEMVDFHLGCIHCCIIWWWSIVCVWFFTFIAALTLLHHSFILILISSILCWSRLLWLLFVYTKTNRWAWRADYVLWCLLHLDVHVFETDWPSNLI